MVYVPKITLDEIGSIKDELGVSQNVSAFEQLTKYAQVGREAERIKNLDFLWLKRGRKR